MGKLLILPKYFFVIYGTDIYETRRHIHVSYNHKGALNSCKFWLEPELKLDENKTGNFTAKELIEIRNLIIRFKDVINDQLDLFHHHQPIKAIKR